MVCKHKDCFNCPEIECVLEDEELEDKEFDDIVDEAARGKRALYNKTYYQKHKNELRERAKLRARKIKKEKTYRMCKHCGKKIDLKKGAVLYRKKYFCSGECLKNYLLKKVEKDVKDVKAGE